MYNYVLFCCFFFLMLLRTFNYSFFFFNDTATTEIYTLSLHDALPIFLQGVIGTIGALDLPLEEVISRVNLYLCEMTSSNGRDRKSTRLNSSHQIISYAVFCLKKKKLIQEYEPVIRPYLSYSNKTEVVI